jgi:ABC-2 type transport system permease protein
MTLLATERIKLFTTRSPWWCMAIAIVMTVGFAALVAGTTTDAPVDVPTTQFGYGFGLVVIMVMAVLAVTTEYRFGTIRATFAAVPSRTNALLAKATVVALLAGVIGELAAFASWGVAKLIKPSADLALTTAYEWRVVALTGVAYALSAVIAVAVGTLIRHSAGAISLVLIYALLVEDLVKLIPNVGPKVHRWLPFVQADHFLSGDPDPSYKAPPSEITYSPWLAGVYFAAFALILLAISVSVANRRDA